MGRGHFVHFGSATVLSALVFVLATLGLALPAPAGAYLYWEVGHEITRANLNGSSVKTGFIPNVRGDQEGVAVSSQYIYFAGFKGVIGRASLDGSNVDLDLMTIPQPPPDGDEQTELDAYSIAVAGTHAYWATQEGNIGRASVDGGGMEPDFIHAATGLGGIAVDSSHIYWGTEHAIGRASLDGSRVEPDFIQLPTVRVTGVAVADGHIYWTTDEGHLIGRANADGRGVDPHFLAGLGFLSSPVVGGSYLYWQADEALYDGPGRAWIGRARLNGSGVEGTFINVTKKQGGYLAADALGPGGTSHPSHAGPVHHRHTR